MFRKKCKGGDFYIEILDYSILNETLNNFISELKGIVKDFIELCGFVIVEIDKQKDTIHLLGMELPKPFAPNQEPEYEISILTSNNVQFNKRVKISSLPDDTEKMRNFIKRYIKYIEYKEKKDLEEFCEQQLKILTELYENRIQIRKEYLELTKSVSNDILLKDLDNTIDDLEEQIKICKYELDEHRVEKLDFSDVLSCLSNSSFSEKFKKFEIK